MSLVGLDLSSAREHPFAQTGVQTHPCPTVRRALEPGRTGGTGPPVPGAILPGASGIRDVQQDPLDSCTKSSGQRRPPVVPRLWPQLFVASEGLDGWKRGPGEERVGTTVGLSHWWRLQRR